MKALKNPEIVISRWWALNGGRFIPHDGDNRFEGTSIVPTVESIDTGLCGNNAIQTRRNSDPE